MTPTDANTTTQTTANAQDAEPQRSLDSRHRRELHGSGLTDETIGRLGFYSCENDEGRRLLNWGKDEHPDTSAYGLVIPYPGQEGYAKVKFDVPRMHLTKAEYEERAKLLKEAKRGFGDHGAEARLDDLREVASEIGDPIKYEAPKGAGLHCYIPLAVCPGIADPKAMLYLTEGEKKAALMCQEDVPCIGLPGVSSAHDVEHREEAQDLGNTDEEFVLNPELLPYVLPGREVCILFDTPDTLENVQVIRGAVRTAKMVLNRGAVAKIGYLPKLPGLKKVGIDDYVVEVRRLRAANGVTDPKVISNNLSFSDDRPVEPNKQLAWLQEKREEEGLNRQDLLPNLRQMTTWARVWHERDGRLFNTWARKAAKMFGLEPSELHDLAAPLKVGAKFSGARWNAIPDERLVHVCMPILQDKFTLFRGGDGTERTFSLNARREATVQVSEVGLQQLVHDGLKAAMRSIPPERVITRGISLWRREVTPMAAEPEPFCFRGDDRICFKRFDWEPAQGPHLAWDEFLVRLSDPDAFKAFVWSAFDRDNCSRQYVWLRGEGQDGKSVVLGVLQRVFGQAAAGFTGAALKGDRFLYSSIYGRHLVIYADCKNSKFGMTEFVRVVTSGDPVQVEFKGMTPFTHTFRVKLFVASNVTPELTGATADQSRIIYIEVEEAKNKDDPSWAGRLEAELPAFLWDCRETYQRLCPNRGDVELNQLSKELRVEAAHTFEENFHEFFQRRFLAAPGATLPAAVVLQTIRDAGVGDNDRVADFRSWMVREKGVKYRRTANGRIYEGIKLVPDTFFGGSYHR